MKGKLLWSEADANGDTLNLYENCAVISRKVRGAMVFLATGVGSGDKIFPYEEISSVQFNEGGGWTGIMGYIEIIMPGSIETGRMQIGTSENAVLFKNKDAPLFKAGLELIYELKEKKRTQGNVVSQDSAADEIKKFAKLRDEGIISEDEFNSKKKELLGL